ncbi:hypothetical protein Pcinc_005279 [Petrolisthes cinctipes]|uniref:Uncharacterized protein n=1 Tax=Petrolisthes cinctipes TaxID=88211 RepID=A0AAE1KZ89_PETCI|nr:hypothetical protein Pcinc_005279 [Petrolisthes cinctipes]
MNTDDVGVSGVELHCRSVEGSTQTVSYNMDLGENQKRATVTCSDNGPVNAFKFRINNDMELDYDDEGMNDLRFFCRNSGEELVSYGPSRTDSVWSSTTTCPGGTVICGARLKMEDDNGDDTCVNELLAFCCVM